MKTLFTKFVRAFWYDELAARRYLRGALFFVGTSGIAFADQLAAVVEAPSSVKTIKIVGVVCALIGGLVTAGEKNPRPEQPQ